MDGLGRRDRIGFTRCVCWYHNQAGKIGAWDFRGAVVCVASLRSLCALYSNYVYVISAQQRIRWDCVRADIMHTIIIRTSIRVLGSHRDSDSVGGSLSVVGPSRRINVRVSHCQW